jgi:hypothetical protein
VLQGLTPAKLVGRVTPLVCIAAWQVNASCGVGQCGPAHHMVACAW